MNFVVTIVNVRPVGFGRPMALMRCDVGLQGCEMTLVE